MRVMHTHRFLQLPGSLSTRYIGLGGSPDGPLALPGPQSGPPEKPITAVVQVNLVGVIYTVRLGQYYMMKDKSSDPKAIVFVGSMCE
jgi:hypothetical protein